MKRVFVLKTVALMGLMTMGTNAEAKVVRGYVTDRDGNPVQGAKMMIVDVFSQNGTRLVRYEETNGTVKITIEPKAAPAGKSDKLLTQK